MKFRNACAALIISTLSYAETKIDSITIPKTGQKIYKLNYGPTFDFHINRINYSNKTNEIIKDHTGPTFMIGGHLNNIFLSTFFKPWTVSLQKSINSNQDTVQQFEKINPIRTGFNLGYSYDLKYFAADPYVGINWFWLAAGKTAEKKEVDFNSSSLMAIGLNLKIPLFDNGIKTEDKFLKLGTFNVVAGVEYLFGDQSKTYYALGKNALSYNVGIQYKIYSNDVIFVK